LGYEPYAAEGRNSGNSRNGKRPRQLRTSGGDMPSQYLDALHVKLRQAGRVENIAVYNVLGVDLEGRKDVLGHWLGHGGEGRNFWRSVVKDLHSSWGQGCFYRLYRWAEWLSGSHKLDLSESSNPAMYHPPGA
jgi:transposase-like protein